MFWIKFPEYRNYVYMNFLEGQLVAKMRLEYTLSFLLINFYYITNL